MWASLTHRAYRVRLGEAFWRQKKRKKCAKSVAGFRSNRTQINAISNATFTQQWKKLIGPSGCASCFWQRAHGVFRFCHGVICFGLDSGRLPLIAHFNNKVITLRCRLQPLLPQSWEHPTCIVPKYIDDTRLETVVKKMFKNKPCSVWCAALCWPESCTSPHYVSTVGGKVAGPRPRYRVMQDGVHFFRAGFDSVQLAHCASAACASSLRPIQQLQQQHRGTLEDSQFLRSFLSRVAAVCGGGGHM